MKKRGIEAYLAELIGTFVLVFFIATVLAVFQDAGAVDPATGQQATVLGVGYRDFTVVGLTHAFVLMMLIVGLGRVSGGHFNPAVTAAMAAVRKISPSDAVIYVVFQLAGGVLGALLCRALFSDEGKAVDFGTPALSDQMIGGKAATGAVLEGLGTFFLVWAIMGIVTNRQAAAEWAGLVVGGTLAALVFILGPVTGAGFNPARWFGPALVSGEWSDAWAYIIGPVVGAILAAVLYKVVALRNEKDEPEVA